MNARVALGLALLVGGAVLLYFGYNESNSLASELSEVVTGSPTDRSMWFIVGGGVAAVLGGALALLGRRS